MSLITINKLIIHDEETVARIKRIEEALAQITTQIQTLVINSNTHTEQGASLMAISSNIKQLIEQVKAQNEAEAIENQHQSDAVDQMNTRVGALQTLIEQLRAEVTDNEAAKALLAEAETELAAVLSVGSQTTERIKAQTQRINATAAAPEQPPVEPPVDPGPIEPEEPPVEPPVDPPIDEEPGGGEEPGGEGGGGDEPLGRRGRRR